MIPEDPWQLLVLIGVIFIFVSSRASWWPAALFAHLDLNYGEFQIQNGMLALRSIIVLLIYPVMFAGLAGYFSCFWPGKRPLWRMLWAVCFPAVLSLGWLFRLLFEFGSPTYSVLPFKSDYLAFPRWLSENLTLMPSGPTLCAIGLSFVAIFVVRLALGRSSLPLKLLRENASQDPANNWSSETTVIFLFVGPYFLVSGLFQMLLLGFPLLVLHISLALAGRLSVISSFFENAASVAIVIFVLGRSAAARLKASLRLPKARHLLIAFALPATITYLGPMAQYVFDRIQWASHFYGQYSPPQISAYINISNVWHWVVLSGCIAAVSEELVFRGMLLPRFIERYGLHRGILLIGLVWAAAHFHFDSYSGLSVSQLLAHVASRIVFCVALNYVLSWVTLREESVVAAIVIHATWNLLNVVPMESSLPWSGEIRVALLAATAWLLFRRWPVDRHMTKVAAIDEPVPEPAL